VLHELATNAAKYGSLSRQNGSVTVAWAVKAEGKEDVLSVVWHEMSEMPVPEFIVAGLGTALIDQAIPKAKVSREFGEDGLRARLN
jgi:two-component sensor histidine kinase